MSTGLRLGIASQTPLVRMIRSVEEIEEEYGPLADVVRLDELRRGVDYTVTPGGVARMMDAAIETVGDHWGLHGEWVTLATGFPHDLALGDFKLSSARLPPEAKEGYGRFKEMLWNALNGLPPQEDAPLRAGGETSRLRDSFATWSQVNAERLLEADREDPFDLFYVNDLQQLPEGRMLAPRPRVMHLHTPFARWTPPGWKDYVVHHLREFDAVIVSTRRYVEALEREGLERPVHQVYPWLDPRQFIEPSATAIAAFEEKYGVDPDDEVILNVARMDPMKGQDRLVRALALILRRRPRARLVLVGNGSFSSSKKGGMGLSKGSRWRAHLEQLAKELGVAHRVTFTGHVNERDALAAFYRSNVFAFPSVAEGFGLAAAEAWIARKPVVVSRGAGVSELVRDGENGIVVDAADPRDLAGALERALTLPDGGEAMGAAGRETAIDACDVRRQAPRVFEILEAYAERKPRDVVSPDLRDQSGVTGA